MTALIAVIVVHIVASLASTASAFTCAGDGGRLGEPLALKRLSSTAVSPPESVSGTHEALVVFARFSDDSPQAVPSWGNSLFRPEAPGSVAHYYEEQSFGRLHLSGTVLPQVYAAPDARSAYLASDATGWGGVGRFVREVLERADRDVDFGRFDANGDGMVDLVVVLVVGEGIPNFIKGRATGVMGLGGSPSWQTADGVGISPVGGVVAVVRSFPHAVGSVAHELGHWLGLPDLYDLNATGVDAGGDSTGRSSSGSAEDSAGIGMWGLMGWGALGWDETGTQGPTPFGAWEREQLGWAAPPGEDGVKRVVQPQQGVRLAPAGAGGGLVKVWLSPEEYFLMELRDPLAGWYERGCPGRGLLIWHVDGGGNQGDERHKLVDVECADGRYRDQGYPAGRESDPVGGGDNLDFWSHDESYRGAHSGNRGDATDLFDGLRFVSFAPVSNPGTQQSSGAPSGLRIANVHLDAAGASFDVGREGEWTSVVGIERVGFENAAGGELLEPGSEGRVAVRLVNRGTRVVGRVDVRLTYGDRKAIHSDTTVSAVLSWPGDTTTVVAPLRVAAPLTSGTGATLTMTVMPTDGAIQTRQLSVPLPVLQIVGVVVRDGGSTGGGWGNGDGIPNPGEVIGFDLRVRSVVGWGGFQYLSSKYRYRVRFPDFLGESVERPLWWSGGGWVDSTATIAMWSDMLLPAGLAGHPPLQGIFELINGAGDVGWVDALSLRVKGQDTTPPRVRGVEVTVDGRQLRFVVPDSLVDEGGGVTAVTARLVQIPSLTDVETVPLEREGARFAGAWEVPSELAEATLGVAIGASDDAGNAGMTDLLQRVTIGERSPVASSAVSRLGKGVPFRVAYSTDGALLAVASSVGIWLYDAIALTEIGLLEWHADWTPALAFSPDGTLLASAGDRENPAVRLWDVASRREIGALAGHGSGVTSMAFSTDGTQLATASGDSTVRLWDVRRQQVLCVLVGHASRVERVTFSPDGRFLASVGGRGDDTLRLWDVESFQNVAVSRMQGGAGASAFTPDGALLATIESAGLLGTVHLWDVVQGKEVGSRKNYSRGALAFSPDGRTLAVGRDDISLLDVVRWQEVGSLKGHKNGVSAMAFSPDGSTLVSTGNDCTVRVWDVLQPRAMGALEGYMRDISMLEFSPDATSLTVGLSGYNGRVQIWDVASLRETAAWQPQVASLTDQMALSPDWARLAISVLNQSNIYLWDVSSQNAIGVLAIPPKGGGYVSASALAFSRDGSTLAAGYSSPERTVRLWDLPQQKEIAILRGHTGDVRGVAFRPGGQILASGGADSTVRLWDMAHQQEIAVLRHTDSVWGVSFSPDGQSFVSRTGDGAVHLWDVATCREVTVLRGYPTSAGVARLSGGWSFSPAGTVLALGSSDGTVYLWDFVRQQELGIVGEPRESSSSKVVFSPDGKSLASASFDGTVLLWSIMPTAVELSSSDEPAPVLRQQTALLPAYPSPGNPGVWLPYDLAKDGDVTIRIYNVLGQQVRTLAIGHKTAGRYLNRGSAAFWDGRTVEGREVASGVYYCALQASAVAVTRKVVVMR